MTRDELINAALRDPANTLSRGQLAQALELYEWHIGEALARGEAVRLTRFGELTSDVMPARAGRNPRTGQPMEVGETRRFKFRAFTGLKDRIEISAKAGKA